MTTARPVDITRCWTIRYAMYVTLISIYTALSNENIQGKTTS